MGKVYASYKAISGGPNRSDLGSVYAALDRLPVLSKALDAATSSPPDVKTLALMGHVTVDGADVVFKTLVSGSLVTDLVSEPPKVVEVVFHTNHASWRSRKVRRLTEVVIQKPAD